MMYDCRTYPYVKIAWAGMQTRPKGNQKKENPREYVNMLCAFDIETTRIPEIRQSIMYIWQLQLGQYDTVIGRTWDELRECIDGICAQLGENQYIVWYVHNLSFEWQFLRGIWPFSNDDIFAIDSRKILKADMFRHIELRCSYMHANASLEVYLKNMGVKHKKTELDYSLQRWPWTELTEKELEYCINDVKGLVEALSIDMATTGDNLYTVPLTSTGYVRRDAKKAMRCFSRNAIMDMQPDPDLYDALRKAFRGGNTHANRSYAGMIVHNVKCADRASSYPDVMCNCLFPMSRFEKVKEEETNMDKLLELIEKRKRAVICRIVLQGNVRLRNEMYGCPYLTVDKCDNLRGAVKDNGRILKADYLETTLTDVDFRIVMEQYESDENPNVTLIYHARYAKLPSPLLDVVREYFRRKTELKNVDGREVEYNMSKALLNALYGMSAQNPVKPEWILQENGEFGLEKEWKEHREEYIEDKLNKNRPKAFLSYAWGVWVTAWARYRLEEGIKACGAGWVYADTDSVYYVGDVDWTEYNRARIADSKKSGACAQDKNGKMHYMGTFDYEKTCVRYKTMGAKKYAYEGEDGELHITIAGVNKRKGAKELAARGGLESFDIGFVFGQYESEDEHGNPVIIQTESAGVEAVYNDRPPMDTYDTGRGVVEIVPNVSLEPSTYTVGLSNDYKELLENWYYLVDKHDTM